MRSLRRSMLVFVLVLGLSLSGFVVFAHAAESEEVITWKLQAAYPIGTSVTMHGVEWAKAIERMTSGRLKVEILPPGAMCGPKNIINFLEKGVFDAAVSYGGFHTGLIPESDLEISLPLSARSWDEGWDAIYNRGLGEVIQEAYDEHNIKWYPAPGDVNYHFATNFPVKKLSDLKGKKIRALGVFGKYVEALGAVPVVVPGSEMYMAMKLGTIDGAIYGSTGLTDLKLREVVKYYTRPTAAQINLSLYINKDSLAKLPEDLRVIVEEGTRYIMDDTAMRYTTENKKALADAVKLGYTEVTTLPEEELAKMRKLVKPIWDELAAKSPRMKKGVEIIKKQMADLGRPME